MIAQRMKELLNTGVVLDKETGEYRRSLSGYGDSDEKFTGVGRSFCVLLAEEGIPAYSVSREGYFETYEVSVLLDYLKVLDNARQDLPLTAVLTSPFAGLTAVELSVIRLAYPNQLFYEAVEGFCSLSPEEIPGNCGQKAGNTGTGKIEEVFRGIGFISGKFFRIRQSMTFLRK